LLTALEKLDFFEIVDLEDSKQNLISKKPDFLYDFVDWYNEWLMKPEAERTVFSSEEIKTLKGIVHFAKKNPVGFKDRTKLNIEAVMQNSNAELGFVIRPDSFNPLIQKGICTEKVIASDGVFVELITAEVDQMAKNFGFLDELMPLLKAGS
jgi:hypothetical protein